MKRNNAISILIIVITIAVSLYLLKDTVFFYAKPRAQREEILKRTPDILKRVINLGLDLQGGMRLVMEVDKSNLSGDEADDALDRAFTVIHNRIDGLGVAEPTLQKQGKDRLIVELPGLQDEEAAKNVIGSQAQLEFMLLREPAELQKAIMVVDEAIKGEFAEADSAAAKGDSAAARDKEGQEQAEMVFGGTDEEEGDTAAAAVREETGIRSFTEFLVSMGEMIAVREKDHFVVDSILRSRDIRHALERAGLGGSTFLWGEVSETRETEPIRPLYYLKKSPELRGDVIKDARANIAQGGFSGGQAKVDLEMNDKGARKFRRVTAANIGKFLAIVLDSTVYSAPVIKTKIPNGRAEISGSFTMDEAKNLAIVLRAGALPAPLKIIEERTVGPSLGRESIVKAGYALAAGFLVVIVFMLAYYKTAGLIADVALVLNLFFVLGVMAMATVLGTPFTLTLPGMAGLILIIGMSVDANVIIFERIREELAAGKTVRSAVDAGYSRAFVTIMDANITTLITAAILMWVGTGPIRGFAVTLIFGIIVSLYTALYITHVIFNMITQKGATKLSI